MGFGDGERGLPIWTVWWQPSISLTWGRAQGTVGPGCPGRPGHACGGTGWEGGSLLGPHRQERAALLAALCRQVTSSARGRRGSMAAWVGRG